MKRACMIFGIFFLTISCNNDRFFRDQFQGLVYDADTKRPISDVTISAIDSSYYIGSKNDTIRYAMHKESLIKTDSTGRYVIPRFVVNEGGYRESQEIEKKTPHIFFLKKEKYLSSTVYLRKYTKNKVFEDKLIKHTLDTVFLKRIEE